MNIKTLYQGETRGFSLPFADVLTDYTAKVEILPNTPSKTEKREIECSKSDDEKSFLVRFETSEMKRGDYSVIVMVTDTKDGFTFKAYDETLKII